MCSANQRCFRDGRNRAIFFVSVREKLLVAANLAGAVFVRSSRAIAADASLALGTGRYFRISWREKIVRIWLPHGACQNGTSRLPRARAFAGFRWHAPRQDSRVMGRAARICRAGHVPLTLFALARRALICQNEATNLVCHFHSMIKSILNNAYNLYSRYSRPIAKSDCTSRDESVLQYCILPLSLFSFLSPLQLVLLRLRLQVSTSFPTTNSVGVL